MKHRLISDVSFCEVPRTTERCAFHNGNAFSLGIGVSEAAPIVPILSHICMVMSDNL